MEFACRFGHTCKRTSRRERHERIDLPLNHVALDGREEGQQGHNRGHRKPAAHGWTIIARQPPALVPNNSRRGPPGTRPANRVCQPVGDECQRHQREGHEERIEVRERHFHEIRIAAFAQGPGRRADSSSNRSPRTDTPCGTPGTTAPGTARPSKPTPESQLAPATTVRVFRWFLIGRGRLSSYQDRNPRKEKATTARSKSSADLCVTTPAALQSPGKGHHRLDGSGGPPKGSVPSL